MTDDHRIEITGPNGTTIKTTSSGLKKAARRLARQAAGMSDDKPKDAPMFKSSETGEDVVHGVARDRLRSIVERIERLEEEKAELTRDIKDVYAEAKSAGFDTKALRKIVALRKQDQNERLEHEAIVDTYMAALGMLPGSGDG